MFVHEHICCDVSCSPVTVPRPLVAHGLLSGKCKPVQYQLLTMPNKVILYVSPLLVYGLFGYHSLL